MSETGGTAPGTGLGEGTAAGAQPARGRPGTPAATAPTRDRQPLEAAFRLEYEQALLARLRLAVGLVFPFTALYAALDLALLPAATARGFIAARALSLLPAGWLYWASRRPWAGRRAEALAAVLPLELGLLASWTVWGAGPQAELYTHGIALVILATGALYPWPPVWSLPCGAALVLLDLVPGLFWSPPGGGAPGPFVARGVFLLACAAASAGASWFQHESARRELEHRQRLLAAERQAMLARVAIALKHEIHNALTGLLGTIELLELHEGLPAAVRDDLAQLRRCAQRIRDALVQLERADPEATVPYPGGEQMLDLQSGAYRRPEPERDHGPPGGQG
ncbi:MAG: hypothetical protein KatS3mg102_1270 [Planctomycetota bacterium]|nr:MAG: hypothetical protein KatS3mg102_1270 [Planctomycetota bacterium]